MQDLKEEKSNTQKELECAQGDVENLTKLAICLRDRGVWDIKGIKLSQKVFDNVFIQHPHIIGYKIR